MRECETWVLSLLKSGDVHRFIGCDWSEWGRSLGIRQGMLSCDKIFAKKYDFKRNETGAVECMDSTI